MNGSVYKERLNHRHAVLDTLNHVSFMQFCLLSSSARNNENPAILKFLLDAGANPNRQSLYGTPLHLAAANADSPSVLKVLIDAGADLEARGDEVRTPLHLAAESNENPDVARALLDAGANPKARDENQAPPLHLAAASNKNPDFARNAGG